MRMERVFVECCKSLITELEACHEKFGEGNFTFYPRLNQTEAKAKALQVWNFCMAVAAPKKIKYVILHHYVIIISLCTEQRIILISFN